MQKTCLSVYAQEQAAWRREKAEEYPDDPRNLKAALNFEQWAAWLKGLPEDHPYIIALVAINDDLYEYEWNPNADVQAWLTPYFFHSQHQMDFDALTADVIAAELAAQVNEASDPEAKAEKKMAMTYDRLAELNAEAMEATARHNVRTEGMAMKRPSPRTFREATRSFNAHTRLTDVMGKHGLITDADDGDDGEDTKKGKDGE